MIDEDCVQKWIFSEDKVLIRSVALGIGIEKLRALSAHFAASGEHFRAAQCEWAMVTTTGTATGAATGDCCAHANAALSELQKSGLSTDKALQLTLELLQGAHNQCTWDEQAEHLV